MRLLPWSLSWSEEAVFCYFSIAVHILSNLHDTGEHNLFSCLIAMLQPLLYLYSSGYLRVLHYSSPSMIPDFSYLLFTFPLPTAFPGPIPKEWSVLPSGNKLHSFLQVALLFSCCPSVCLLFYLFPDSQYLDRSPCLQESLRSGQTWSWGKGSNMQAQDTGQGSSLPVRCIGILNSPSQAQLPCCQPQQPSQWTSQPWRLSFLLSPPCILSAVGWHRVIETCPSRVSSTQNSHQPIFKYRGDRELRRAARVEASALSLLANSVFLKHISSCACYKSALLLKMSSSNINHESNESIYSRQACIGRNGVKERKKIDRCVL